MHWTVESLLTGRIAPLTDTESSAIAKTPVSGPRTVHLLGIEGDAQADLSVHGGPDKAIHHYPRDHYDWWAERLGPRPLLERAGAFGENISTRGLSEQDVCIGDRFRLGTALVEIAQGRQPCWKQAHRLDDKRVVAMMVKSGRTGWYYRVIEEGSVAAGDALVLVSRLHPEWTVARATALVVAGVGTRDEARELAGLKELAEGWRRRAVKLAGTR
jgi:MOSC domain-containing protein YiiM